jgi:hypothetical protein
MHELATPEGNRLASGTRVSGTVVCHHHFGLGMSVADHDAYAHVTDHDAYGHVNITAISRRPFRGPEDFPSVGSSVSGEVLGYTGDQLAIELWQRESSRGRAPAPMLLFDPSDSRGGAWICRDRVAPMPVTPVNPASV